MSHERAAGTSDQGGSETAVALSGTAWSTGSARSAGLAILMLLLAPVFLLRGSSVLLVRWRWVGRVAAIWIVALVVISLRRVGRMAAVGVVALIVVSRWRAVALLWGRIRRVRRRCILALY